MAELGSDFYLAALRLVRLGVAPLQALQVAARRRGTVVALPEPLAAYLGACTAAEARDLLERTAERAAERERSERLQVTEGQHPRDLKN